MIMRRLITQRLIIHAVKMKRHAEEVKRTKHFIVLKIGAIFGDIFLFFNKKGGVRINNTISIIGSSDYSSRIRKLCL